MPLGPYFADFLCEEARLVVEAGGAYPLFGANTIEQAERVDDEVRLVDPS